MNWPWSKKDAASPPPAAGGGDNARTVVLVGHCGMDRSLLERAVERAAPGTAIAAANSGDALERQLHDGALLLINRVLDGRFDAGGGIDLIEQLASNADPPAMMLVSNYEQAQADAAKAGALPGFGKSELRDSAVIDRLRAAIDG